VDSIPWYWVIEITLGLLAGILVARLINQLWSLFIRVFTKRLENGNYIGPDAAAAVAVRKDPPARAVLIKNKHLLVIGSDPNPRIHGGCFGV